jgi:hypothetical protein
MKIIGLSGYARAGKDEAAKALGELGYQRISFADKLRDFLYALDPIVGYEIAPDKEKTEELPGDAWAAKAIPVRLRSLIDFYGWEEYKNSEWVSEIRPLLQRLGTEAGREVLWDSIWIDAALHDLNPEGKYVITDARFPNEAEAITSRGGSVWRIERKGNGPAVQPDGTVHRSETSLDDWNFDATLHNYGSLEEFHDAVRAAEKSFEGILQA